MFSSLLSLLLVIPLVAAIPVPLEAEFVNHDDATHSGEKAKFDEALGVANTQIAKMKHVLDNDPGNSRIVQAFGQNADLDIIRDNVDKLASGKLKVQTSDPSFADREVAQIAKAKAIAQGRDASQMPDWRSVNGYVPVNKSGGDVQMDAARFGSTFYRGTGEENAKVRAGTIIHEATHQLSRTGDNVGNAADPNKIIRAGMSTAPNTRQNEGYAEAPIPNSDAAMGERYTALREASPNMHHNADSYRVFGALCSEYLSKRALTEEDPVGYYLAKRQKCSLPPDYFKKKAEAKAAAAKGTTATTRSAAGLKGRKALTAIKALNAMKASKGADGKSAKGRKALNAVKALNAMKASKGAKGSRTALAKGAKTGKSLRSPKGAKASKAVKGGRAAKAGKTGKAVRGAKAAKGGKTARGAKASQAAKGSKGVKTAKAGNAGKVAKGGRAAKGVKATKAARTSKGVKVTKGKTTASRAAGRKVTTSRASNKAAGRSTRGNTAKSTKATAARSSQKVTKAAPKPAAKAASKAAPRVAAKASVPKKTGKRN